MGEPMPPPVVWLNALLCAACPCARTQPVRFLIIQSYFADMIRNMTQVYSQMVSGRTNGLMINSACLARLCQ